MGRSANVEAVVVGGSQAEVVVVVHTNLGVAGNCKLGIEMREGTCGTVVDRMNGANTEVLLDYLADQQDQSSAFLSVHHMVAGTRVLGKA